MKRRRSIEEVRANIQRLECEMGLCDHRYAYDRRGVLKRTCPARRIQTKKVALFSI